MIGTLVSNLLSLRWTFHLFAGSGAEEELARAAPEGALAALAESPADSLTESLPAQIRRVRKEFESAHFKTSGLAGPFREPSQQDARENLLVAVESLFDLLYLIGEVLSQFHRISDSLGDYGMIRVALWLHPCLDCMVEKLQRLQSSLKLGSPVVPFALFWGSRFPYKNTQPRKGGALIQMYAYRATKERT